MPDRYDELTMLAYIEGDLAPQQEQAFEQHMREDARLRQLVDLLMADRERLRQLPLEQAPSEIMERVSLTLERQMLLGEASRGPGLSSRVQTMRYTRYLAVSAVAALVLISTGLMLTTIFQSAQLQRQLASSQDKNRLEVLQPQERQADRASGGSAALATAASKPSAASNEIAPREATPGSAVALGPQAEKHAAALPPGAAAGAAAVTGESRLAAHAGAGVPAPAASIPAPAAPAAATAPALELASKMKQSPASAEPNLPEQLAMKVMRQKEESVPLPMQVAKDLSKEQQAASTADSLAQGDLELRVTTSHSTVTQQFLLAWAKNHRAVVLEPQTPATPMLSKETKLALADAPDRDATRSDLQRKDAGQSVQQSQVGANREEMIATQDLGSVAEDKRAADAGVSGPASQPAAQAARTAAPAARTAAPAAAAAAPAVGAKAIAAETDQTTTSQRLAAGNAIAPAAKARSLSAAPAALSAPAHQQPEPEVAASKKADALQQQIASNPQPAGQVQVVMHLTREQLEQLLTELRELPGLVVQAPAVVPGAQARARETFRASAADADADSRAASSVLTEVSQIELQPPTPGDESETFVPRRRGRAVRIILLQPATSPEAARQAP